MYLKFQFPAAVNTKTTLLSDATPRNLLVIYRLLETPLLLSPEYASLSSLIDTYKRFG